MPPSQISRRRAAARLESSSRYTERRTSLIEAAARIFSAKGFRSAGLDEIAAAAGLDRASLYYYVSSKRELFYEVVHEAVEANVVKAEEIRDSVAEPAEKLRALIVELMVSYAAHYPYLFVFIQEDIGKVATGKSKAGRKLNELILRFDATVTAIIEQGAQAGVFRSDVPPRVSAFGLIGMVNWTHRWFTPDGPMTGRELGEAFATLLWDGLRSPSA
jgi:TetR/AcrR family transcriptional regulator, cholesterol catabolism regulator